MVDSDLSIGSSKDTNPDDIFPRTLVAQNISGTISIRDGNVYMESEVLFSLRQGREGYNGSDTTQPSASGVCFALHLTVYICKDIKWSSSTV